MSINIHGIAKNGFKAYWQMYSTNLKEIMFRKHVDYRDEREFRGISFLKDEYDYIDIEGCLVGIIVPYRYRYESSCEKEMLHKFAERYGVEILYIKWESHGIIIETKNTADREDKILKEMFNKSETK
ncbi:MAG: hypothetical protein HYZ42_06120 [Bacteroidetes bacterium]|nr:hypothetical protein [Bacteroidota bacterium]